MFFLFVGQWTGSKLRIGKKKNTVAILFFFISTNQVGCIQSLMCFFFGLVFLFFGCVKENSFVFVKKFLLKRNLFCLMNLT